MKVSLNLYNAQTFGKNRANQDNKKTKQQKQEQHKNAQQDYPSRYANYGIHPASMIYGWKEINITKPEKETDYPKISAKDSNLSIKPSADCEAPYEVLKVVKSPQELIKYYFDSRTEAMRMTADIKVAEDRYNELCSNTAFGEIFEDGFNRILPREVSYLPDGEQRTLTEDEMLAVILLYSYFSQNYDGSPVNGLEKPSFIKSVKDTVEKSKLDELSASLSDLKFLMPADVAEKAEEEADRRKREYELRPRTEEEKEEARRLADLRERYREESIWEKYYGY